MNGEPRMRQLKRIRQLFVLCVIMIAVYVVTFGIDTAIDCYQFCQGKTCFSSRLTILVYRDNVSPKEMDFLQNFRLNVGYYKYATDHLSGRYDPESCSMEEYFSQFTTIPAYNNCAIVGNSGILLHSNCGNEINSYDYVIRVNLPAIQGYEEDVGFKTNLTLLNFETLVYLHSNLTQKELGDEFHDMYVKRVLFLNDSVLWYGKSMGPRETRKRLQQSVEILKGTYKLPVRIGFNWRPLHPEKFVGMKRLATSGFMAYYAAKSFCSHVTLYGFYPSSKDARGFHLPHHYYEDVPYEYSNPIHDLLWEFQKYREYASEGKLHLVTEKCADSTDRDETRWANQDREKPIGDLIWFKQRKP
ncbi:CMP-N-acetylneuraminate-poly-alpha-2,8-sialyltransferase-like [Acanthaster planci]|uniref:CMP-N-acetylneuraminate-poly-alpha-2, 8-sialyltransferase-like n=1 Tax=Acanthaster planci TaxID=133434 RepID=A0A8B7YCJ2_ACAPL|nr:CMP-N-acetylneuraminate-poly-alpha-2,8-sialyltransferase-like [Acanthaster planci]